MMIKSIEGIRGIAAIIVALYHLKIGNDYFPVIRHGYLFVDLFFVLSGFVMCANYAGKIRTIDDVGTFLIRRFGRLFPLLILSSLIFVLLANGIVFIKKIAVANGYSAFLNNPDALQYVIPSLGEALSTLTMTHSLGLFDHLILNTPTWSISTEFYTYFLFAGICSLFIQQARLAAFALLSITGLLISVWASINVHDCIAEENGCLSLTYDFGFPRCVASFFLGAIAYHSSRLFRFNPTALQITSAFSLYLLISLLDYAPVTAFVFPVAFALLVIAISTDSGPLADTLKHNLFQKLGQRSYSIYLMHMPLLLIFENFSKRTTGLISMTVVLLAYVVVLYLVSGGTYKLIENPFRLWFNRLAEAPVVPATPVDVEIQ